MIGHVGAVDTPDIQKLLKDYTQSMLAVCKCGQSSFERVYCRKPKKGYKYYLCSKCGSKYVIPKNRIIFENKARRLQ